MMTDKDFWEEARNSQPERTVAEIIEILKTLDQNKIVKVGGTADCGYIWAGGTHIHFMDDGKYLLLQTYEDEDEYTDYEEDD